MFDLAAFMKGVDALPQPLKYDDWLRVYDKMTVHTQGRFSETLRERRPGEPDEVFAYRDKIMQPITKGKIEKGMDNLSLIFQNTAYSLTLSKILSQYLMQTKFSDNQDFKAYCETKVLRIDIEDPNGVLIWLPVVDPVNGDLLGIEPRLYNSRKIRYANAEAIMLVDEDVEQAAAELKNKTFNIKGKYNTTNKRYLLVTTAGYYYLMPPKGSGKTWTVDVIFENEYDQRPSIILGGNITGRGFYESFFGGFVPFGDEALMSFSDHQAVNVQFSYPVREEKGLPCDAKGCTNGYTDKEKTKICLRCRGTGKISTRSPWGVYITKENELLDADNKQINIPAVQFHSPDTGILDYSSGEWKKMLDEAADAIHLVYIDEAQSGVAKNIDLQGKFCMIKKAGDNYYDNLIYNSLWIMEQTLSTTPQRPQVYKPAKYQIDYTKDPIDDIYKMIQGGTPKYLISMSIEEFLQRSYDEGNPVHKMTAVLIEYDRWFCYTPPEKDRLLAQGVITKEDYVKSAYAFVELRKMIREYGGDEFLKKSNDEIIAELQKGFDEEMKKEAAKKPAPQVRFDAAGNVIR